ncbi:MAG TPA: Mth938-like domain-containing protein [Alphaproteobacteria bacterium]|nr:Mth938-like domain-containing protein [Alphaproteobacteria bacterium]
MKMEPVISGYNTSIAAYGDRSFTIAGEKHAGSILLMPESVASWPVERMDDLTVESLETIVEHAADIELLIVGTGHHPALLPTKVRNHFRQRGIAIEAMATGPACRTYNVLLAEHRLVAAALIAVD